MFSEDDLVVYGTNGVCVIEKIGKLEMSGVPGDKEFYTLSSVRKPLSKFYLPVNGNKIVMRAVITREEAENFVDEIGDIEPLKIVETKKTENIYKECLRSCDIRVIASLIKGIYLKNQARLAEKKPVIAGDERYFKLACDCLYDELSIALGIEKENMESYITENIEARLLDL